MHRRVDRYPDRNWTRSGTGRPLLPLGPLVEQPKTPRWVNASHGPVLRQARRDGTGVPCDDEHRVLTMVKPFRDAIDVVERRAGDPVAKDVVMVQRQPESTQLR